VRWSNERRASSGNFCTRSRTADVQKLTRLWLYPPLAFARLGSADTPLDAFFWGPNDDTPRGTGTTSIQPAETLAVRDDGTVFSWTPAEICFHDDGGIRPVCPFFELHGEWSDGGVTRRGPLTPDVVESSRLRWRIDVANLKPFNMTRDEQTKIVASVALKGNECASAAELQGRSPQRAANPLVPADRFIPLGFVRLTCPNREFPGYRLRFTPGRGKFFGPPTLPDPWKAHVPPEQLFLNAGSSWCRWKYDEIDPRAAPKGQYAQADDGTSVGLVDDVCDGIVSCAVDGADVAPAVARIVVGPPDYAPDRRTPVSLADGLKDRVDRAEVLDPSYFADMALVSSEVGDLLERAYETANNMNVDALDNLWSDIENPWIARQQNVPYDPSNRLDPIEPTAANPLPLTAHARANHRRFFSIDVLTDFVRKHPDVIRRRVREPRGTDPFFDPKMPMFMRGSTGGPLHLSRRQYDLLLGWARKLGDER
jgi:hypothetical protein